MAVDPTISSCEIRVVDEVATLSVLPTSMWEKRAGITPQMRPTLDRWWEIHADLARALAEVRDREDVRVIVLTGAQEGTFAYNISTPESATRSHP